MKKSTAHDIKINMNINSPILELIYGQVPESVINLLQKHFSAVRQINHIISFFKK